MAATAADSPFTATTIERRDLRDDDVRIDIKFAGICHSDIHTKREEWGEVRFPLVPGHEIAGVVSEVGSKVTKFKVGDRVGVGCMVDSCGSCEFCKDGEEQYCTSGMVPTYAGTEPDGEYTQGGYSQQVVVSERFVLNIPEGIELDVAAPLLCAGITTFAPLQRWGVGPGKKVAVVGMGGLGHMAVKIAAAMGAEVTVLSRTLDKQDDAREFGAAHHYSTKEKETFEKLASSFDVILNTVSADLPMEEYLSLVKPLGTLVSVGIAPSAYEISSPSVIMQSKNVSGSLIGGIPQTQEMLDFCAQHGIGATIEKISADQIDEAYDKVVAGDVRYRYVIDTATIPS